MNVLKKVGIISIICIIAIIGMPNTTQALNLTDIEASAKRFIENDDYDKEMFNEENEKEAIDQIYYIALGIGIIAAFIVWMVLGIQFITSGVEGQAKVKAKLIPAAIGTFVVFGAYGIWRIVLNVMNSTFI